MKRINLTPSSLFLITLIAGLLIGWFHPYSISTHIDRNISSLIGVTLLICSLVFNTLAYHKFKKSLTPHAPFMRPKTLITDGIFSISRNPVYLALLISQVGLAFIFDSIWLLVSTLILWILLDTIIVRQEEKLLEMTFLSYYKSYKKKTRRWF